MPFACIGGVLALYVRGMHLNMSSAVGFTALFGVAMMDGVLMVRWITTLRMQGMALDEAIVQGAWSGLRPILMTSIVAIFGLLPASLATGPGLRRAAAAGHGHRVGTIQFDDADALRGSGVLPHPRPRPAASRRPRAAESEAEARSLVEPLPDVSAVEIVGLLEYLHGRGGDVDIFHIADETNRAVRPRDRRRQGGRDAGTWSKRPGSVVVLTAEGERFAEATPEDTKGPVAATALDLGPVPGGARGHPARAGPCRRPGLRAGDDRDPHALRELREDLQYLHPLGPFRQTVLLRRGTTADYAGKLKTA